MILNLYVHMHVLSRKRDHAKDQSRDRVERSGVATLLLVWFAAAYAIGVEELLHNEGGAVFQPIALSAVIPVAAFLGLYALSDRVRAFVLRQNIRTLTTLQHWRVVGFVFLPLYFFDVLPGLFAWPAGLGDVSVGLAAAYVVARFARDPDYETSSGLVRYQFLGLLDLAVAMGTAGLAGGGFPALIANGITTAPMDVWPLNLFPSFIIPIFIILHLSVLLKVRYLRRQAGRSQQTVAQAA